MITILIETILGSLTGYVTNDVALRQLFKAGGVVEKERASFVNLLVDMLQREILDETTMQQLSTNEAVVDFFDELIHEALHGIVPNAMNAEDKDFMARYAAMLSLVKGRLSEGMMPDLILDGDCLVAAGDAVLEAERTAAWDDLSAAIMQESLYGLGIGRSLHQAVRRFVSAAPANRVAMLESHRGFISETLKDAAGRLYPALHDRWTPAMVFEKLHASDPTDAVLTPDALVGWFGEALAASPALRAHVRAMLTQQLHGLLQTNLPAILSLLEEMLSVHEHELETMLWASIEEALTDMREPFRSVVLHAAKNRLEDEADWMAQLFDGLQSEEMQETLCQSIEDALMQQVDSFFETIQNHERPGAYLQATYRKFPDSLRYQLYARLDVWMHRPILQGVNVDAWKNQAAAVGVGVLYRLAQNDTLMVALDHRVKTFIRTPLAQWMPETLPGLLWTRLQTAWQKKGRKRVAAWASDTGVTGTQLDEWLTQALDALPHESPEAAYRSFCALLGEKEEKAIAAWVRQATFAQLPAFVGRLTHEQLDALSQADLRHLVLDLLGNEMRPLSYLGAVVGGAAGAATGVTMSMTGISPDPQNGADAALLFAGRSLLYGSVGYGTNVMAVHGLFKPYKKRFGWQGLLPRNQARFALKMNEMAYTYVLNDDIWSGFANRAKERWLGHRTMIVERMVKPHTLDVVAGSMDEMWRRIPVTYGFRWAPEAFRLFCLSRNKRYGVAHALASAERRLLNQNIDQLPLESTLNELIHRMVHQADFEHHVRMAVRMMLSSAGQRPSEPLAQLAETWRAKLRLPDYETLEPVFYRFGQKAIVSLPDLLWRQRETLAEKLADAIFERLSRMMQMGFAVIDGEQYILRALEIFLDTYAPAYFERHQSYFETETAAGLAVLLAEKSGTELGLNWDSDTMQRLLQGTTEAALQLKTDQWLAGRAVQALQEDSAHNLQPLAEVAAGMGADTLRYLSGDSWAKGWLALNLRILDEVCHQKDIDHTAVLSALQSWLTTPALQDMTVASCMTEQSAEALSDALYRFFTISDEERVAVVQPFLLTLGDRIYPPVVDFVREEGRTLVALVDLPVLTETRIASLDSRELEQLVRQIANPYFHHVERMGWWGAVVAMPATMLAMIFQ